MDRIKDIYESSDMALSAIIKIFKDSLLDLSKEKVHSYTHYMQFTELVKYWQETVGLSKLIMTCYEFYEEHESPKMVSEIQKYMTQYASCKSRIFLIIGSLKDAIKADISTPLDKYIDKSDNISQVEKLMSFTKSSNEIELIEENTKKDDDINFDSDQESSESKSQDSQESRESISEKDLLGDDILADAKTGGINELSDVTVIAGNEKVVVGENYKFHVRSMILNIKNSETREEQIESAGFSDENELDNFMKNIDKKAFIKQLIKKYGLAELYTKSLENLLTRINSYCANMSESNTSISNRFKKLIRNISDTIKDPLSKLELDLSLYHMSKCFCAFKLENEKFKTNIRLMDNIKLVLKELAGVLKADTSRPEPDEFDIDIFDIEMTGDDNLQNYVQLQRKWIKPMVQLEVYFGELSMYVNSQWIVYDSKNMSVECAKYRIYLLNQNPKWTKSELATLSKLSEQYRITEFDNIKKFIEATA